jgi:hypothetical protein
MTGKHRIYIHFRQDNVLVFSLPAKDKFQPGNQFLGFGALMGFDVADNHIHTFIFSLVGGLEHGVGFSYPGGIAKKNLKFAALSSYLFVLGLGEESVGVRAGG